MLRGSRTAFASFKAASIPPNYATARELLRKHGVSWNTKAEFDVPNYSCFGGMDIARRSLIGRLG
jgi:hypothetical protein